MNPCPCGNYGHPKIECVCTPVSLERYRRKISGPIADRIDLWSSLGPVELSELGKRDYSGVSTTQARAMVAKARSAQAARSNGKATLNSELSARELHDLVPLSTEVRTILETAGTRLNLSPRAYHRVIKVARTIADLDEAPNIDTPHILEALQYRERKT